MGYDHGFSEQLALAFKEQQLFQEGFSQLSEMELRQRLVVLAQDTRVNSRILAAALTGAAGQVPYPENYESLDLGDFLERKATEQNGSDLDVAENWDDC